MDTNRGENREDLATALEGESEFLSVESDVADAILEGDERPESEIAPAKPKQRRAPRRESKNPRTWPQNLGPITRKTIDRQQAESLQDIAEHLQPGLRARIARIRPTWCAGWLEDQQIESSEIAPLLEYIATEHGGQTYRVTVLSSDGRPVYDGQIQIAGPPKTRGRAIDRDEWEGIKDKPTATTPQPKGPDNSLVMVEMMKLLLESERHGAKNQIAAVREIIEATRNDNAQLMKALLTQRVQETAQSDVSTQIMSFAKVSKALSSLRDSISPPSEPAAAPTEEKTPMSKITDAALNAFVSNVVASQFGNGAKPGNQKPAVNIPIPDAIFDDGGSHTPHGTV